MYLSFILFIHPFFIHAFPPFSPPSEGPGEAYFYSVLVASAGFNFNAFRAG